jgi:hypothetical protein
VIDRKQQTAQKSPGLRPSMSVTNLPLNVSPSAVVVRFVTAAFATVALFKETWQIGCLSAVVLYCTVPSLLIPVQLRSDSVRFFARGRIRVLFYENLACAPSTRVTNDFRPYALALYDLRRKKRYIVESATARTPESLDNLFVEPIVHAMAGKCRQRLLVVSADAHGREATTMGIDEGVDTSKSFSVVRPRFRYWLSVNDNIRLSVLREVRSSHQTRIELDRLEGTHGVRFRPGDVLAQTSKSGKD